MILLGTANSAMFTLALLTFAVMGTGALNGPLFALPGDFLTGTAAASGIVLVTSIGSLGGFVGPSLVGAGASGSGGIYRGLAISGASLFVSASLVLMLPKDARRASAAGG